MAVVVFFTLAIVLTIIEAVIIVVLLRRDKLEQSNTDDTGDTPDDTVDTQYGTGDVGEKFFYEGKWYQIEPEQRKAEDTCYGCAFYGKRACLKFDCVTRNVIYKEVK